MTDFGILYKCFAEDGVRQRKTPISWQVTKPIRPEDESVLELLEKQCGKLEDGEIIARVYVNVDDKGEHTTDFAPNYAENLDFSGLPVYTEHKYVNSCKQLRSWPDSTTHPVGHVILTLNNQATGDKYVKIRLDQDKLPASQIQQLRHALRTDVLRDVSMAFSAYPTYEKALEEKSLHDSKGISCKGPFGCGSKWVNLHEVSLCNQGYFTGTNIFSFRASETEGQQILQNIMDATMTDASSAGPAANTAPPASSSSGSNAQAAALSSSSGQSAAPQSYGPAGVSSSPNAVSTGGASSNGSAQQSTSNLQPSAQASKAPSTSGAPSSSPAQSSPSGQQSSEAQMHSNIQKMISDALHQITSLQQGYSQQAAAHTSSQSTPQSAPQATSQPPSGTSGLSMQQVVDRLTGPAQPSSSQAPQTSAPSASGQNAASRQSPNQDDGKETRDRFAELTNTVKSLQDSQRKIQESSFLQEMKQTNLPPEVKEYFSSQAQNADEGRFAFMRDLARVMQTQPNAAAAPVVTPQTSATPQNVPKPILQTSVTPAAKMSRPADPYATTAKLNPVIPSSQPIGSSQSGSATTDITPKLQPKQQLFDAAREKLLDVAQRFPDNMVTKMGIEDQGVSAFLDTLSRPLSETVIQRPRQEEGNAGPRAAYSRQAMTAY